MAGQRVTQPHAANVISTVWDNVGPIAFRTLSEPHRKRARYSDESIIGGSGLATPASPSTKKSTCSEDINEHGGQNAQECLNHDSMVCAGTVPNPDPQHPVGSTVPENITAKTPDAPPHLSSVSKEGTTGILGLNFYHREVDYSVTDRFDEVSKQLEPALVHYLHKRRVAFRPLAIQLLVLGATEDTAKPCIVVLCPALARKKVKRFFGKDFAIRICQGPPNCQIRFDAHVVGRSLETLGRDAPNEVFMEEDRPGFTTTWTPQIKVMHHSETQHATMGGFVCVTASDGKKSFYGLTVGHIVPCDQELGRNVLGTSEPVSETESSDTESDSESTTEICSDAEEQHSDFADQHIVEDGHPFPKLKAEFRSDYVKPESCRQWISLGAMSSASYSVRARNRDWALTHITAVQERRITVYGHPFTLLRKTVRVDGDLDAAIDNRVNIPCSISALPARVLLPSGHDFVDVKVLRIYGDEKPAKGASGSWIVDYDLQMRVSVYGMLIATDPFGSFWMMPMTDILADIQEEKRATDVHLASQHEILGQSEVSGPTTATQSTTQKATNEAVDASTYFSTTTRLFPETGSHPGPSKDHSENRALRWEEFSKRFLSD